MVLSLISRLRASQDVLGESPMTSRVISDALELIGVEDTDVENNISIPEHKYLYRCKVTLVKRQKSFLGKLGSRKRSDNLLAPHSIEIEKSLVNSSEFNVTFTTYSPLGEKEAILIIENELCHGSNTSINMMSFIREYI